MVERRGGWRGSPGSLAALDRHRPTGWQPCQLCAGRRRQDGAQCGQPAVPPSRYCRRHGGRLPFERLTALGKAVRLARAVIRRARRDGRIPRELAAHPAWMACQARRRLAPHQPVLLAAWCSPDASAWPAALATLETMEAAYAGSRT